MTRRRFLRATSFTLLILCLAAWGWSHKFVEVLIYYGDRTNELQFDRRGIAYSNEPNYFEFEGWRHSNEAIIPGMQAIQDVLTDYHLFGFSMYRNFGRSIVRLPWWFPTLLLAAVTWWTWRKTRTKAGRGFAVDAVGEKANDAPAKASEP
jgi:hypothetical protein